MFLKNFHIDKGSFVTDIVTHDYRTAEVFRKYGIEYSGSSNGPLEMVCQNKEIEVEGLINELNAAIKNVQVSNSLPFHNWNIDFLADYIVHVHHHYLINQLPEIKSILLEFEAEHPKKFKYLTELERTFLELNEEIIPHLKKEEEVIFPYIRQIVHAFDSEEQYASLLVKTLRKPVEEVMHHVHNIVKKTIHKMRELTHDYVIPEKASVSHKVTLLKLKELDNDLMQHQHLENNILYPRAIAMENILLRKIL